MVEIEHGAGRGQRIGLSGGDRDGESGARGAEAGLWRLPQEELSQGAPRPHRACDQGCSDKNMPPTTRKSRVGCDRCPLPHCSAVVNYNE